MGTSLYRFLGRGTRGREVCRKLISEIKQKAIFSGQVKGKLRTAQAQPRNLWAGSSALAGLTEGRPPCCVLVRRSHQWAAREARGGATRRWWHWALPLHQDALGLLSSDQSTWADTNPKTQMERGWGRGWSGKLGRGWTWWPILNTTIFFSPMRVLLQMFMDIHETAMGLGMHLLSGLPSTVWWLFNSMGTCWIPPCTVAWTRPHRNRDKSMRFSSTRGSLYPINEWVAMSSWRAGITLPSVFPQGLCRTIYSSQTQPHLARLLFMDTETLET